MEYSGEELKWHTESEITDLNSSCSSTSMPGFKRGMHEIGIDEITEAIIREGQISREQRTKRPLSLLILADARVQHWPKGDNVCQVEIHPEWGFPQWVAALRAETIRVACHIVVLYLEKTVVYPAVLPLKNGLQSVCKAIRQHHHSACIFVGNMLPSPSRSPLKGRVESDFILLQAVRSINRVMGKVHYMSLFEHLVSRKGNIISPTHQYFREDGDLTGFGCMVLRECILRESKVKTYWF